MTSATSRAGTTITITRVIRPLAQVEQELLTITKVTRPVTSREGTAYHHKSSITPVKVNSSCSTCARGLITLVMLIVVPALLVADVMLLL
jgi:hypothetical protein